MYAGGSGICSAGKNFFQKNCLLKKEAPPSQAGTPKQTKKTIIKTYNLYKDTIY